MLEKFVDKFWALSNVLSSEFNRFSGIPFCCRFVTENWLLFPVWSCIELTKFDWKLIVFIWELAPEICVLIGDCKLSWEICPKRSGEFIRGSIGGTGANVGKTPTGVVNGLGTNGKL